MFVLLWYFAKDYKAYEKSASATFADWSASLQIKFFGGEFILLQVLSDATMMAGFNQNQSNHNDKVVT